MSRSILSKLSRSALLAFSALLWICSTAAWALITIETVPVGDVGNPNDPATGNLYGGVSYFYRIGKHEVTTGQYVAFLNAVAATDTYGLYTNGGPFNMFGIARSGTSGSYQYSVIYSPNHPVIVYWGNAARFANWLHNGQPTGPQNENTTEDGAYTLNGAVTDTALSTVSRNNGATFFIPSENEWYKAAYHQPASQGGDSDHYWNYPMRTNSVPYSDEPAGATPDNMRVGNFFKDDHIENGYDDGYAITLPPFTNRPRVTEVGSYIDSPSYYGTFDQGGNVWEWNETLVIQRVHGHRGGEFAKDEESLRATVRGNFGLGLVPTGFRVATIVPEPGTAMLAVVAGALMCVLPRRRA
jgi:formylglycine-generating enzyme required for sulfatase activity